MGMRVGKPGVLCIPMAQDSLLSGGGRELASPERDFYGLWLLIAEDLSRFVLVIGTVKYSVHIVRLSSLMRVMPNRIKIKMSIYYKLPPHTAVHMSHIEDSCSHEMASLII